jgi:ribosomal protein L11 methyltransferase
LQQVELRLSAQRLPRAEALLALLGALALSLDGSDGDEILEPEPGATPVWPIVRVRALFPPGADLVRISRMLGQSLGTDIAIAPLDDADWTGALTPDPREQIVGRRLMITGARGPSEHTARIVVRLRRGLGFGTGDHPTTRLCLEWLDAELGPDAAVLDYGCGSGILAVAAVLLGARRAWAVDVEPQAIEGTRANAALNAISDRLWIGQPDELPQIAADVVLANVLAGPLVALAPRLAALSGKSGTLVLSGLLRAQSEQVRNVYADYFTVFTERELDGWVCLTASGRKR